MSTQLKSELSSLGVHPKAIKWRLSPEELVQDSLDKKEGKLIDSGALCIYTGKYTGRSPKDRFIVKDASTESTVDWNAINQPISDDSYQQLKKLVTDHLSAVEEVYVHDGKACAAEKYSIGVRVVAEKPWSAQFANNMFLRLSDAEKETFAPDWKILCAPTCFADDPAKYGINDTNFVVVSFTEKTIIIGGSGYTGEIKKGIFSILNYMLPHEQGVLTMHCSSNIGKDDDTAVFFGLSGTGKTTLSTDPNRKLIGDDEHGWSDEGVFNFEGGCYAKLINLSAEKEPEIYNAIRPGAIVENIGFVEGTNTPDFENDDITQNTRVSYPIYHIDNIKEDSQGGHPCHVFFLTCDAFGVLPPVSRLDKSQAMYHFISGYTAKVAGTEAGVTEPQATFSACFGAPFLPLHPGKYADMLGKKMNEHNTKVWLINTGWTGGANPEGHRISLKYTRAIINAILNNELENVEYSTLDTFNLSYPTSCPNVPDEILNPRNTWSDSAAYDKKAEHLASLFVDNFAQYEAGVTEEIKAASPTVNA